MDEPTVKGMESSIEAILQEASGCPVDAMHTQRVSVEVDDALVLPKHKRMVTQYVTDKSGVTELHLHYDEKEIVFDESALFAFGETLTKYARFVAGTATDWGNGYEWPRVRELLEQLIEEGILRRAEEYQSEMDSPQGDWPSPLPATQSTVARTWFDCASIMRELTGHPLELSYLEFVVPLSRVAHMALDAEGRQVGEANVFPPQLRLLRTSLESRATSYRRPLR